MYKIILHSPPLYTTGGDQEKFKEINEAYEVLRDPEKRSIYDQYGEEAVKDGSMGGGHGGHSGDIFSDLFGMGGRGGGGGSRRERKADDVHHKMKVTMEEMYTGRSRKLQMKRKIKCDSCSGSGSKSGKRYKCETCHGSGVEVKLRPLGPGMVQQIQTRCSTCQGSGFFCPASDRCGKCSGSGLVDDTKVFEVNVEPGHRHGEKIIFRGEAGTNSPDVPPGDLIFTLEMKENKMFDRHGIDLLHKHSVNLVEALTGAHFHLEHLDGRVLQVSSEGQVIKPNSWMVIRGEGMPLHGRPYEKGNLYVNFKVEFPETVTAEQAVALKSALGSPAGAANGTNGAAPMNEDDDEMEEVTLVPVVDMQRELKMRADYDRRHGGGANDSDSDEEGGGPRVACAQQ